MDPKPRGVLDPRGGQRRYQESLHPCAPDLSHLLQHCWEVCWDLRGCTPYPVNILAHPTVNLVTTGDRSWIQGVVRGRFTYMLEGKGQIFGLTFQPAGFRPFAGSSLLRLADQTIAVSEIFGPEGMELVEQLGCLKESGQRVEVTQRFIRDRLPAPDPNVTLVNSIVEQVMADRQITRVDQIVRLTALGKRKLQRLFSDYVGISPKWVIQRYRLQEAAERLGRGEEVDIAALAQDLGYYDQAHFVRDFRALVGQPPAGYARGVRLAGSPSPPANTVEGTATGC